MPATRVTSRYDVWVLTGSLALAVLLRSGGLVMSVVDWDESLYALVAREMLHGHLPYVTIWANKPPGLFLLIAAGFKLFGTSVAALRVTADLAVAAGAYLLYRLGLMFGEQGVTIGIAAAVFYVGASCEGGGLATNAELFVVPLLCAAMLIAVGAAPGRPAMSAVSAAWLGLWVGLASQVKETAIVEGAATAAIALLFWRIDVWRGVILAGAAALPTLFAIGIYASAGHLAAYFDANLFASMRFSAVIGLPRSDVGPTMLWEALLFAPLPLLGTATLAIAARAREIDGRTRSLLAASALWLAVELLVLLGLREYEGHQFVMLAPPLALLSAFTLNNLTANVPRQRVWITGSLAAFCAAHAVVAFIKLSGVYGERAATGDPMAGDEYTKVARVVNSAMRGDRSLFVMHSQPIVYLLTGADVPTRYVYPPFFEYPVQEQIAGIDGAAEVRRVRAARPHFILTTQWVFDVDSRTLVAEFEHLYPDYAVVYSRDRVILFELRSLVNPRAARSLGDGKS